MFPSKLTHTILSFLFLSLPLVGEAILEEIDVVGVYAFGESPGIEDPYGFFGIRYIPYMNPCQVLPVVDAEGFI